MTLVPILFLLHNVVLLPFNEWDDFEYPGTCVGVFILYEAQHPSSEQVQCVVPH